MNKKNGKPLYLSAVQIEKRFNIFRTALAACVAILFCFFLILLSSKAPGKDIITFLTAPLSSFNRFCTLLIKLSPLLFTSCATCILFAADTPNCSVESAFYIGSIAATSVGVLEGIPGFIHFPLMVLAGVAGASIVLLIPSLLNYLFNANILVTSLMLNYVCNYLGNYLVTGPMRDPTAGYEATKRIATAARLPKFISSGASQVHIGLLIGLVVVLVAWFLLYKSKFGYESRTVGTNREFALRPLGDLIHRAAVGEDGQIFPLGKVVDGLFMQIKHGANLVDARPVQVGHWLEAADAAFKQQGHEERLHRIVIMMAQGQLIEPPVQKGLIQCPPAHFGAHGTGILLFPIVENDGANLSGDNRIRDF